MTSAQTRTPLHTLKVCGVVSASDAELVTSVCRTLLPATVDLLIGAILWPHSPRSVSPAEASAIAAAALANGATPVAVFVDETPAAIESACARHGFPVAQLHGRASRAALRARGGGFASGLRWIDVRDVAPDGSVVVEEGRFPAGNPMWRLFDAKKGGTGEAFDWARFPRPDGPWLLAGGLHPANVAEAVAVLRPDGVDVASGVAGEDRCRKDEARLRAFVERLVEAYS